MGQTLESVAARVDTLEKQVSELFDKVNDTRETQSAIVAKLDNVLVTIGEVKQAVGTLQGAPSRRWEAITTNVITAVIAAIVGFVIAKFK